MVPPSSNDGHAVKVTFPPPAMKKGGTCSHFHPAPRQLPEVTNTEYLCAHRKRASEGFASASKRPCFFVPTSLLNEDPSGDDDEDEEYNPLADLLLIQTLL